MVLGLVQHPFTQNSCFTNEYFGNNKEKSGSFSIKAGVRISILKWGFSAELVRLPCPA